MKVLYLLCILFTNLLYVSIHAQINIYQYAHCSFEHGSVKLIGDGDYSNLDMEFMFNGTNISDGKHAFAISTFGYNPLNSSDLGQPFYISKICVNPAKSGDINFNFKNGSAIGYTYSIEGTKLLLNSPESLIGRSLVIYNGTYDCANPNVTDLGSIIASCVIGRGNPAITKLRVSKIDISDPIGNTVSSNSAIDKSIYDAMATFKSTNFSSGISGWIYFKSDSSNSTNATIEITAIVHGLSPSNAHGIHIHTYGDLSSEDLGSTSVGQHWSSDNQTHSLPLPNKGTYKHFGDLGNICIKSASSNSTNATTEITVAYYKYTTSYFNFSQILGRGIAIHANRDDGVNVGGDKIAVGVIGLVKKDTINNLPEKVPTDLIFDVNCPIEEPTPSVATPTPSISTPANNGTKVVVTDSEAAAVSSTVYPYVSLIIFLILTISLF